jgi:hypothetical protein
MPVPDTTSGRGACRPWVSGRREPSTQPNLGLTIQSRANKRKACATRESVRFGGWGQSMIDRIQAALPSRLARTRALSGLVLACLLLAGCVTSGDGASPTAGEENASPKSDPAAAQAAAAAPGAGSGSAVSTDPVVLQRRRQAIARTLEESFVYRTAFDVKLIDTKIAGPLSYVTRSLFSASTQTETIYCVTAELDIPWIHTLSRTTVIRVKKASDGSELLRAATGINNTPSECRGMGRSYGPFPEMEQLRAQRRKAMGKTD